MFKKVLSASVHEISENTKLVRISFLTGFFSNLRNLIFFAYTINNILHYKYELTPDTFEYYNIIMNRCIDNGLAGLAFGVILVAFVCMTIVGPIGTAAMVYLLDSKKVDWGKAVRSYFPVVVLHAMVQFFTMESWHIGNFARMYIINITDNILVQIVIGILGLILIVCTILFPFATFFLLLSNSGESRPEKQASASLGASSSLVASHIGTTIKFTLFQIFLHTRFLINLGIVIGVPGGLLYLMHSQGWLDPETRINISIAIGASLLFLVLYVDALINAFFLTFWYKLYRILTGKPLEDPTETKKEADASTPAVQQG